MKAQEIEDVFEFWKSVMNHTKSTLDNARRAKIRSALASYTVDECKEAILGCRNSEFHQGDNKDKKNRDQ